MIRIRKEDYQKYADEMIDYYGVKRDEEGKISPFDLLQNMGLNFVRGAFDGSHSVFGAIVFEDRNMRLYDSSQRKWQDLNVKANTVIVDWDATKRISEGSFNLTIFHECIHFHYHKMAFRLWRIFNKESIYYETSGKRRKHKDSCLRWMEIQANGIAPYLMVQDKVLKSYIESHVKT